MRILVISNNSFSKTENNGKTLCSIFSGFEPNELAQLYFGVGEEPNEEFCSNYYRVTEIDILKSIYSRSHTTVNTHQDLICDIKNNIRRKEPWYYRKIYSRRMRLVREYLWKNNIWDSPELRDWIERFKPEAIFAMLGSNIYSHSISILLSERYNIPLFVYFTDDYVLNSTARSIVDRVHYRLLRRKYKETVSKAYMSYAIGRKMQCDYSKFFSKPFGILGNSIDIDKYSHLLPKKIEKDTPILISYIGAIHSNRWKTIVALGEIVKEINSKYHYGKIQIKVFSPTRPRRSAMLMLVKSGVEFCGVLDSEGVLQQMEQSHFLLHVESFDKRNRTYVRYSVSTKISEYLSSNRVVLAYGPHEVASMQLLKDNNLGCCLTDLDTKEEIVQKICAAIENYNSYDYTRAKQFVLDNYSREVMSGSLMCDLSKAIQENNKK